MDILKKKVVYNGVGLPICEKIEDIYTNDSPDYWTRLEHQAAIATMGGICGNTSYDESSWESMVEDAILAAHTLVQQLKEKEERK